MPSLRTRTQQPTPVSPQVQVPSEFPAIPQEVLNRFPSAADWQRRFDDFWTTTKQALQEAQNQVAKTVNSRIVFTADQFLIYANGVPTPMFYLDSTGVRLGNVLVVNTPYRKVYIGAGNYQNADTPFYVDGDGKFSLGASLTWDPDTDTLTVTGTIIATSGTIGGFNIGADYIRDVANSMGLSSTVTAGDDVRFWSGSTFAARATAPFRVTESGELVASNATISGTIAATSGAIGGFDIGSDYIRDAANSFGLASTVTGSNDVRFWAGAAFASRATAPLRFFEDGTGVIAGWTIGATSFSATDIFLFSSAASGVNVGASGGAQTRMTYSAGIPILSQTNSAGIVIAQLFPSGSDGRFELYDALNNLRIQLLSTGTSSFVNGVSAASFSGAGSALTSLSATNISSGTLATARLPSTINIATAYQIAGTQVVTAQQAAIANAGSANVLDATYNQAQLETLFNAFGSKINEILAALRTHGLIAT